MKMLLCKLAWKVLWKWWPDRVFEYYDYRDLPAAHPPIRQAPTFDSLPVWVMEWREKLDHAGRHGQAPRQPLP